MSYDPSDTHCQPKQTKQPMPKVSKTLVMCLDNSGYEASLECRGDRRSVSVMLTRMFLCEKTSAPIESNSGVMMGKPVVRGTRITVEHILEKLAAGVTIEQILQAHPRLTRESIVAAIEFGARAVKAGVVRKRS